MTMTEQLVAFISEQAGVFICFVILAAILVWKLASNRLSQSTLTKEVLPSVEAAEKGAAGAPLEEGGPPSSIDPKVSHEASLLKGLARTRGLMVERLDQLLRGRRSIDEELWGALEELLITSDVGVRTSNRLLEELRSSVDREALSDPVRLRDQLREKVRDLLVSRAGSLVEPSPGDPPVVWIVVGVNGAGKTTTIGKLASRYVDTGERVVVAAGDTYRAAAIDQLAIWGQRSGSEVVRHAEGGDPAAVIHDAIQAGIAREAGLVICDTAGRLHTKGDLMAELQKIRRVAAKLRPGAPHEVLLVLDATSGQNAIAQAREFAAAVDVTGIVLTKLDGTARGGVIIGIADEFDIPVKLIGVGEGVEDLRDFDAALFVEALFDQESGGFGRGSSSLDAAEADEVRTH